MPLAFATAIFGFACLQEAPYTYADAATHEYVQEFTEDPVNDWTKSDKGNVSEISREYLSGSEELRLTGGAGAVTSPTGSAYLASVFYINPEVTDYTDFTYAYLSCNVLVERIALVRDYVPYAVRRE